jgi:nucleoside-diphosphate-sugar epimerase
MNLLITGNKGYVGSFLTLFLKNKNYKIFGFDSCFFKNNLVEKVKNDFTQKQYKEDIRYLNEHHLENIDTVIHLCGLSNDPIGKRFEKVTDEINYQSSVKLFKLALKNNVKKFIFASSCSSYGFGGNFSKTENSKINPLTAYAKSKVKFEKFLEKNKSKKIDIIILRFATACGVSPRLRLDLVLNDFVYSAVRNKKILIKSNGKPLRPLIDLEDMCKIIKWAIHFKRKSFFIVNSGSNINNYSVYEIAMKVKKIFKHKIQIELNDKLPDDKRSYKVNFNKLKNNYPGFKPKSLKKTILELKVLCKKIVKKNKQKDNLIRLYYLRKLIKSGKLNKQLFWKT